MEAAHATIATLLGLPVDRVSLDPPRCIFGKSRLHGMDEAPWLVSELAAREAALHLLGFNDNGAGSRSDEHLARNVLAKHHVDHGLQPYRLIARRLVVEKRKPIIRVAKALMRARELSGAEVAAIVQGTGQWRRPTRPTTGLFDTRSAASPIADAHACQGSYAPKPDERGPEVCVPEEGVDR